MVLDGITHIRLTGGEPLLRRGLRECVATLDALRPLGLQRISMTSNASLLAPLAAPLKAAGLDDLNISLDRVDPATFLHMTGRDLAPFLSSIPPALSSLLVRPSFCDFFFLSFFF